MKKIITIGEALIDFIPATVGTPLREVATFTKKAGGAPANVAASAALLGGKAAFIGKLGLDAFGEYIIEVLKKAGVMCGYIKRTNEANTTLAFVSLEADGSRDFSFYRKPGADMLLMDQEIEEEWFDDNILHFCSVSLVESPVKYAHKRAISYTKKHNGIISFDPNLRFPLWDDKNELKKTVSEFLYYSDIVKVSDDEIEFITGASKPDEAARIIFNYGPSIVVITKGEKGAALYSAKQKYEFPGFKANAIDTTGAGDAFMGGLLYFISEKGLTKSDLTNIKAPMANGLLEFASATAVYSVEKYGAIDSFPRLKDVKKILSDLERKK